MADVLQRIITAEPVSPAAINREIPGEAAAIMLKALAKEKDRRYASAASLADDVERYLLGDAISARPPSLSYQLRVFARRHKALVGGVTAVFAALLAGVIVSTSQYLQAEAARTMANRERDEAQAVTKLLGDGLASIDPYVALGRDITVREMLDGIADRLDTDTPFSEHSLAEATLRKTIGMTYRNLGMYTAADTHLRKALDIRKRVLGEEHLDTVASMHDLATTICGPFQCESGLGDVARAEPLLRRAVAIRREQLGDAHRDVAESLQGLARLLWITRRYVEAEESLRRALMINQQFYGTQHRVVASTMSDLADTIRFTGNKEEAKRLAEQAHEMRVRLFGDDHLAVAESLNLLTMFVPAGESEAYGREALKIRLGIVDPGHPLVTMSVFNHSRTLARNGKNEEAESLLRKAIEDSIVARGGHDAQTGWRRSGLGRLLLWQRRFDDAEAELMRAHHGLKAAVGGEHDRTFKNLV